MFEIKQNYHILINQWIFDATTIKNNKHKLALNSIVTIFRSSIKQNDKHDDYLVKPKVLDLYIDF